MNVSGVVDDAGAISRTPQKRNLNIAARFRYSPPSCVHSPEHAMNELTLLFGQGSSERWRGLTKREPDASPYTCMAQ